MSSGTQEGVEDIAERAALANSPDERRRCLEAIEAAFSATTAPGARGELLMCRARLSSNQWQSRQVLADALAAVDLFEEAGEHPRALEAASLGAAHASRLGELSIAADLATRCILGLPTLGDRALVDVANRLGIFCYSFLDYDRAASEMTTALRAAERCGDKPRVWRQLFNVADAYLLGVHQDRALGQSDGRFSGLGTDRLAAASEMLQRLMAEATPEFLTRCGAHYLQASLMLEEGHPAEALAVLGAADHGSIVWTACRAATARIEARCLRALGRKEEAVAAAKTARELGQGSDDHLEIMLALDDLVLAERDAGMAEAALAAALDLKQQMWLIHSRQTAQVVEQVWARAALEGERRDLEARTEAAMRFAEEDALTRIGNRRLLERSLAELAAPGVRLSLLMADIDHFKVINDTFGHELGDHVLRTLGHMMAADARAGQVVVRFGGEEFVLVLPAVELEAARDFAERLRARVSAYPWEELEPRLAVTISIGAACGLAEQWRSVLSAADGALYLAKKGGRNRVEVEPEGALKSA